VRILSRYILKRFLLWFAMLLVGLSSGVLIAEMLLNLDELIAVADGLPGAIRFLAIKFCAYYLPVLIPMATFAATFMSLGLATRWLEVLAAKAGGVSPLRIAAPVLAAAAVIAVLTLLVNETLVIQSERAWRHRDSSSEGRIEFRRGSFWYHTAHYIYNVGDADPTTRTLRDLRVFELSPEGRLVRRVHAGLAQVDAGGLRLFDATVFAFPPDSALAAPVVQWQRELRLDVPELSEPPLLEAEPATLSLPNLWELISQRAGSGDDVTRFRAMLHARLSDPPSVLVLALLAVPLALRVERTKSLAVPALQGGVLLLIFWSLRSGARVLAPTDGNAAIAIPWLLVAAFALFGTVRLARVPR
jgi:lipopolysaccharide export system permease protein